VFHIFLTRILSQLLLNLPLEIFLFLCETYFYLHTIDGPQDDSESNCLIHVLQWDRKVETFGAYLPRRHCWSCKDVCLSLFSHNSTIFLFRFTDSLNCMLFAVAYLASFCCRLVVFSHCSMSFWKYTVHIYTKAWQRVYLVIIV
jgi:hypothetical protein